MGDLKTEYYGRQANLEYFSVSQFKRFQKCSACAMAELNGEWCQSESQSLFLGSLMDALLVCDADERQRFFDENQSKLFKKNGEYYADVEKAMDTFRRIDEEQPKMKYYLSGKHQVVMTGKIEDIPFKIKMDSYMPHKFIADMKYMKSLRSPNLYTPMIEYWGYDIQAACYQEIVYQNTGEKLPFFFVVATKEAPAHLEIGQVSQENMDKALGTVKKQINQFQKIKNGELPATRCESYDCNYCTSTKVVTEPIDTDWFGLSREQMEASHISEINLFGGKT